MTKKLLVIIGLAFTASAVTVTAQNAAPIGGCGAGRKAGQKALDCPIAQGVPGWSLTAEQRAERQQLCQAAKAALQTKQANGTLTADEAAVLQKLEQCGGGGCVPGAGQNGMRRGPGIGKGMGQGMGQGACGGQGRQDRTGPRNADGICPGNPKATGR